MTLRDAIVAAHEAGDTVERNRLLTFARERGATVRALAPLVGTSHESVWRWTGGKRVVESAVLSDPVGTHYGAQPVTIVVPTIEARGDVAPGPQATKE